MLKHLMAWLLALAFSAAADMERSIAVPAVFGAALRGEEKVLQGEIHYEVDLTRWDRDWRQPHSAGMRLGRFALADLDGNGQDEMVLSVEYLGQVIAYEILQYQDGRVYGYDFGENQLRSLKTDGTFSFFYTRGEQGCLRLRLDRGSTSLSLGTYVNSGVYYQNRAVIGKRAFDDAMLAQAEKPDAAWYPLEEGALKENP